MLLSDNFVVEYSSTRLSAVPVKDASTWDLSKERNKDRPPLRDRERERDGGFICQGRHKTQT